MCTIYVIQAVLEDIKEHGSKSKLNSYGVSPQLLRKEIIMNLLHCKGLGQLTKSILPKNFKILAKIIVDVHYFLFICF